MNVQERKTEERLWVQRRQFFNELTTMPEGDPRRRQVSESLREATLQLRQLLLDKGVDLCADSQCVRDGSVRFAGKRWCPLHARKH